MLPAVVLKRRAAELSKRSKWARYADDEEDQTKTISDKELFMSASGEDTRSRNCPYLDTINRSMLDFDFEKLCSVSLSNLNVYACLVCGKYFQGRGNTTHAHTHSVSDGHHVFLNLETHRFYCLPDDYEIINRSLEDITYLLNPTFTPAETAILDSNSHMVRAYNGLTYYQGIVGLNNIKANDYCNVILQLLSHVSPLRDYFLTEWTHQQGLNVSSSDQMQLLVVRFGELIRKVWNPRHFKTHVSPHEFLQAVVLCSRKRFQFTEQGDAVEFISWLLNALNMALASKHLQSLYSKSKKGTTEGTKQTIVTKTLQGSMCIYSRKIMPASLDEEEKAALADNPEYMETSKVTKFFYLTCDLPPPPLYLDEFKESIIPQVALSSLLAKFNGTSIREYKTHRDSILQRFELRRLPPYLVLYMKRFVKNIFTLEKNPTIVNFPIKSIDFGDLLVPEYKRLHRYEVWLARDTKGYGKKLKSVAYTTYNLVANVVHDGPPTPGSGTHRIHLLHRGTDKWFEIQDLHVTEVLPQMIPLSETLLQVWAVNTSIVNPDYRKPKHPGSDKEVKMNDDDRLGSEATPNKTEG